MKKIFLLITLILLPVIICSCGNKDKSNKKEFRINEEKPYVGIWESESQITIVDDHVPAIEIYLFADQKSIYCNHRAASVANMYTGGYYYTPVQATDTQYVIAIYKESQNDMLLLAIYDRDTDTLYIDDVIQDYFGEEYIGQTFARRSDDPGEYDDYTQNNSGVYSFVLDIPDWIYQGD